MTWESLCPNQISKFIAVKSLWTRPYMDRRALALRRATELHKVQMCYLKDQRVWCDAKMKIGVLIWCSRNRGHVIRHWVFQSFGWIQSLDKIFLCLEHIYPMVIKHGLLENGPCSLVIFLLQNPFSFGDFPASHVWWNKRVISHKLPAMANLVSPQVCSQRG